MTAEYILTLSDPRSALETVGGKGASLARLANAGLPVPDGFHVTTEAYRKFVTDNHLQERILQVLATANPADVATLEATSQTIAALFAGAPMPAELVEAISAAYTALSAGGQPAVAVRSSATAEDLPGLSFAGQQETYLNIHGTPAILDAVKRCWASLWTARAIGYRAQHDIPSDSVSLAVVVQTLVRADVSGVMFTANPVNGDRDQAMITAAWGLGETIVGGLVTPDTLTVDKATGRVLERQTAEKEVMTVTLENGTREEPLPAGMRSSAALSDADAAALTRLGVEIEALYGMPMDVEWTLASGELAIVQARPITALPEPQVAPPSEWKLPDPKGKYARGSIVDLLPDPLTPLFRTLGNKVIDDQSRQLFAKMTGRKEWPVQNNYVINDYAYITIKYPPLLLLQVTQAGFGQFKDIMKRGEQNLREDALPNNQRVIDRWQQQPPEAMAAADLLEGARQLFEAAVYTYTILQSGVIPAAGMTEMLFTQVYNRLIRKRTDPEAVTFLLGFESAPIRSEKALYDLAVWARTRPDLAGYLSAHTGKQIAAGLRQPTGPAGVPAEDWQDFQARVTQHLEQYGHTLYDLDFSKPVPTDDPGTALDTLRMYLSGEGRSPYERTQEQGDRREQATRAILQRVRGLKRNWFQTTLKNAQKCAPAREDGLANLGLGYPLLRKLLLELGRRLVEADAFSRPDDIFWLTQEEAQSAAAALDRGETVAPMNAEIAQRKALWNAEKRIVPPTMLPENSTFFGIDVGNFGARTAGQEGDTIKGAGAFPGRVTGVARVLRGPEDFGQMKPGDILVASITTPAWTPLFAMASAIVTDIGGPLSHSSIVAREYGIPAVLGTGVASRRIHSGQTITVDGSAGLVILKGADGGR